MALQQFDNEDSLREDALRAQRMTADETRSVIALWQQEREEQGGLTDKPAVPDVAEGLNLPVADVQRLLAEVRARRVEEEAQLAQERALSEIHLAEEERKLAEMRRQRAELRREQAELRRRGERPRQRREVRQISWEEDKPFPWAEPALIPWEEETEEPAGAVLSVRKLPYGADTRRQPGAAISPGCAGHVGHVGPAPMSLGQDRSLTEIREQ